MLRWTRIHKISQAPGGGGDGPDRIVASIVRVIRENKFKPSGIFNFEPAGPLLGQRPGCASACSAVPGDTRPENPAAVTCTPRQA